MTSPKRLPSLAVAFTPRMLSALFFCACIFLCPNSSYAQGGVFPPSTGQGVPILTSLPATCTPNVGPNNLVFISATGVSGALYACSAVNTYTPFGSSSVNISTSCGVSGGPITGTGTLSSTITLDSQTASTPFAIPTTDCGSLVYRNNATAVSDTLAQAGVGGSFPAGWFVWYQCVGAGGCTVTPATSTINGTTSLSLSSGAGVLIQSDGTNYRTFGGGGGGVSVTIVGTANQITATGTCTGTGTPTISCALSLPSALLIPGTINKITLTQPATGATLTILDGKTLAVNNSITLTATDGSSVAFGAGGTVAFTGASQTFSGNNTFTGSVDASGATHTLPILKGIASAKPATCTLGEVYFATDALAGQNLYFCTATNTWTQQLNSGGGSIAIEDNSGSTIVPTATILQFINSSGATWALTNGGGGLAQIALTINTSGLVTLSTTQTVQNKTYEGVVAEEVVNAAVTGTTVNLLAKLSTSAGVTQAVIATTADTLVPVWIVSGGAGTTGNAQLASGGQTGCIMDATASNTYGMFVVASTTTGGRCHPTSTVSNVYVIGVLLDSATTTGSLGNIAVTGYFVNSAGSGTGCTVGGVSGDLQMNNGTGGCSPSRLNDNGTWITSTEPVSMGSSGIALGATAGTGGVTANLLAVQDTSNPAKYVLPASGGCGSGIADATVLANATFHLYAVPGLILTGVADNAVTAGHILIGGTTTPGDVRDSGVTTIASIPNNSCVVGKATANALAGAAVTFRYYGPGQYGSQIIHSYGGTFGTPGGAAISTGLVVYVTVPQACTIVGYDIKVDAGTATIAFWKVATGTALPTVANSISTSGVSISTGTNLSSNTTSDFTTTSVAALDVIAMTNTASSGVGWLSGTFRCQ